jgi:ribosome-binding protein aMBF1 (putative translation factor)
LQLGAVSTITKTENGTMANRTKRKSADMGLRQKFARHLRKQREQREWSLRQMAQQSGISLTRLWNYEQGNHSPNLTALSKVARAFETPLWKFIKELS